MLMTNLFEYIAEFFEMPGIRYAFIVGPLIAVCTSLLGVTLVLKRYSFIGEGLSYTAFGAMAFAAVVGITNNMLIALPATIIAAIILLRSSTKARIKGDAAVAMLAVGALGLGYLLLALWPTKNFASDVCRVLFGDAAIISLTKFEVIGCVVLSVVTILLFIFFYHKIFAVTFDENFARATGVKTSIYNLIVAIIIAIIIVIAMKLVGSLLVSALIIFPALTSMLIIFPALTSMRMFKTFKSVTISSAIISLLCFVTAMFMHMTFSLYKSFFGFKGSTLPIGSTIVALNIIVFLVFTLINFIRTRAKRS